MKTLLGQKAMLFVRASFCSSFHHVHGLLLNNDFMTRKDLSCFHHTKVHLRSGRAVWAETLEAFTELHAPCLCSQASLVFTLGLPILTAFCAGCSQLMPLEHYIILFRGPGPQHPCIYCEAKQRAWIPSRGYLQSTQRKMPGSAA